MNTKYRGTESQILPGKKGKGQIEGRNNLENAGESNLTAYIKNY